MNEKKQAPSLNSDIHLYKIPYKLNQLPYKPIITLAVDKLTKSTIGFSIQETRIAKNFQIHTRQLKVMPINCAWNSIANHFADIPGYVIDDGSTEFCNAIFAKALKKFGLEPKFAWDNTVDRSIKIKRIVEDIFVTLSLSLREHPRSSPKNPSVGELWRQRGRRFPRS
jgi:hypothetical protein